ncbi:AMP-binding protein [Kineobactrum salinum]|uniref:AMP-binding protein n=1 Tax=Kineobactrum salinum TaxID=2708301 RepID=UPI0018D74891|nr:AMP-binding protein [Kineobactrum salinum]
MQDELTVAYHAKRNPEKAAVIMGGSGEILNYLALENGSNQGAHLLRDCGLEVGDAIAICVANSTKFFYVAWAALRSGLRIVPVSTKLTAKEIAYIVNDCAAKVLVTAPNIGDTFCNLPNEIKGAVLFSLGQAAPGYRVWDTEVDRFPVTPIDDEEEGLEFLYTSGTTGLPKGIVYHSSPTGKIGARAAVLDALDRLNLGAESVYLCPAPLYHSAPFAYSLAFIQKGATVVVMESFDAEKALHLIDRYKVTISQWVPTHFVRLVNLPEEVRSKYDISSLQLALHSAASCPVSVKKEMIDWWGPILYEHYGSSEQTTLTFIDSKDWLAHPGSVGKCILGKIHICDDNGEELPVGSVGQIYSEGSASYTYHNSPESTLKSKNQHGWTTVGDMGRLDEDGYLYLSDRKDFMIITGGVNVYPQEIENLLVTHPRILDAAVIGTPDQDFGEIVTAFIHPQDMNDATPEFAEEIRDWCRDHLSSVKVPKRIEFRDSLPRLPTGKMVKGKLKKEYLRDQTSQVSGRIVDTKES